MGHRSFQGLPSPEGRPKTRAGTALTRELVSVARCNASVTPTRIGGSLEAWITWEKRKGLCYCKLAGIMSSVPGCSQAV